MRLREHQRIDIVAHDAAPIVPRPIRRILPQIDDGHIVVQVIGIAAERVADVPDELTARDDLIGQHTHIVEVGIARPDRRAIAATCVRR